MIGFTSVSSSCKVKAMVMGVMGKEGCLACSKPSGVRLFSDNKDIPTPRDNETRMTKEQRTREISCKTKGETIFFVEMGFLMIKICRRVNLHELYSSKTFFPFFVPKIPIAPFLFYFFLLLLSTLFPSC